ncbi:MAG: hypothetical protein EPO02_13035 [Nitrospirae bacterium]|nr:MAG: hypothetical protein EPO02_13035 [Nitrospirota bacterium]
MLKVKTAGQQELQAIKQSMGGVADEVKRADAALKSFDTGASKASAALKSLKSEVEGATKQVESGSVATSLLSEKMLIAGGIAGTMAFAFSGAAKAAYDLVAEQGKLAEQTSNLATRTGLTIGQVERFQAMAKIAGVNVGALESSAVLLASSLEDTGHKGQKLRAELEKLGVSTVKNTGGERDYGAVLLEVLGHLATVEESTKRLALAKELLGKGAAKQLGPLISDYETLNKTVRDLGVGLNENVVKTLANVDDEIDKAHAAWEVFKKSLAAKIAPIIVPIVRTVTDVIAGNDVTNVRKQDPTTISAAKELNQRRASSFSDIVRGYVANLIPPDEAESRRLSKQFRSQVAQSPEGIERRLASIASERGKLETELASGDLLPDVFRTQKAELASLDREKASLEARLEAIKKAAADYKHQLAEIKKLESELGKLREEADLKPYGEIGRIELRRRNKVADIEANLPAGAKRDQLVADFNRAFGQELAEAAQKQAEKERLLLQEFERAALKLQITPLLKNTEDRFKQQLHKGIQGNREEDQEAVQNIRFTGQRFDEQRRFEQRRNEALAGPGEERQVAERNLAIELRILEQRRAAETEIAERELEDHELRMKQNEIEREYERDTAKAREETELRILDLRKRSIEQAGSQLFGVLTGRTSGQDFLKQQFETFQKNTFDRLYKSVAPIFGKIGEATGLGGLLQGTILDPNQAASPEIRSRDQNTEAIEGLTSAITGKAVTGNPLLDSILGQFPGATPPFVSTGSGGQGGGGFLSGLASFGSGGLFRGFSSSDYSVQLGDGRATTASALGLLSPESRMANVIGSAALLGGGAYGVYSGLRAGGARGITSAISSGLGTAAAVDPEPISKSILTIAAAFTGIIKNLFGDPKQERENQIRDEVAKRRYTDPTAIDRIEDRDGNSLGYDYQGGLRRAGGVTVVINALDVKSFLDRSADVATAITKELRAGNDPLRVGIQKTVFGMA